MGLFEETAEVLLAGEVPDALLAGEAGQGFVFHFEPLQTHNADVFLALLPDLALTQLHAKTIQARPMDYDDSLNVLFRRSMA